MVKNVITLRRNPFKTDNYRCCYLNVDSNECRPKVAYAIIILCDRNNGMLKREQTYIYIFYLICLFIYSMNSNLIIITRSSIAMLYTLKN